MDVSNKLRPLFVLKILYEYTDDEHFVTIAQVLQILHDDYNIESYRKTVKEDIDLLMDAGYDIEFVKSSQNKYHIISRDFDVAELKMLIDAVASSKFISKTKSRELTEKLSKLAGPYSSKELTRNIDVERRIKGDTTKLFLVVDTINTAINQKKKIAFKYFSFNIKKEKKAKHNGEIYRFSPYRLVWNGDYYYVVGFSEKYQDVGSFRIDRICDVPTILEEETTPIPKEFDINVFLNSMFRMYNGERVTVELICHNSVIDTILDKFGESITIFAYDMDNFKVIVNAAISHVFFSWIFGFGGKVKINGPKNVKDAYAKMVREAYVMIQE